MEPGPALPSLTPTSPSESREAALHSLSSLQGAILHIRSFASTATPTAEEGGEAPGGQEGGPKEAQTRPPDPGAETHLQARAPTERRQTHLHTLRTRLRAWMTSHVNVTHAGGSRSAAAPVS